MHVIYENIHKKGFLLYENVGGAVQLRALVSVRGRRRGHEGALLAALRGLELEWTSRYATDPTSVSLCVHSGSIA